MAQAQLSPHDETILFQLVEIERNLPREEQSRRFKVKVYGGRGKAPEALIRPAATSKEFIMRTDAACFGELAKAGDVDGGRGGRVRSSGFEGATMVDSLHTVQLTESAFRYYDEQHDFPTSLADERRRQWRGSGLEGFSVNRPFWRGAKAGSPQLSRFAPASRS